MKYVDLEAANGHKILSRKWVFRIRDDGTYKARLTCRGFEQVDSNDVFNTYSPVVNMTSLRTLLAIAAAKGMYIEIFDVKTAFLYGDASENVFLYIPTGYKKKGGKILKLLRSLYGCKDSPRKCLLEIGGKKRCGSSSLQAELAKTEQGAPPTQAGKYFQFPM